MISFASDNCAPVHPSVMAALNAANEGHAPSYGADALTARVSGIFNEMFGREVYSFLMMNGTGANCAVMAHITRGYSSAICTDVCHMYTSETGAPERISGIKLLAVPHKSGKLTADDVEKHLDVFGNEHHAQPRAVVLTQATEFGTVYTPDEIRAISDICHRFDMLVYMDGARIANAAAFLNLPVKAFTMDAGVDILCFGGTKNGMMFGESLIFFDKWLGKRFCFTRKNTGQLSSKMRYIAAQFGALLDDELWLKNARHANDCAKHLADNLKSAKGVKVVFPVETNQIFMRMDAGLAKELAKDFIILEHDGYWRLVTSWDTKIEDIDAFAERVK